MSDVGAYNRPLPEDSSKFASSISFVVGMGASVILEQDKRTCVFSDVTVNRAPADIYRCSLWSLVLRYGYHSCE
jgi:hypothetical protein